MYESFEHTADIGLRAWADDLDGLLVELAKALFSVIVPNFEAIRPVQEVHYTLPAAAADDLARDWLAELLFTFDTRRLVFCEFAVNVAGGLQAVARGEPFDPARHEAGMEVKAITYHDLSVAQTADGWRAEVIVDI